MTAATLPASAESPRHFGGLRLRASAAFIDVFVVASADVILMLVAEPALGPLRFHLTWPLWVLYAAPLESSPWQATLGKRHHGVTVIGPDGGRLGFGRAVLRNGVKALPFAVLPLMGMVPGVDPVAATAAWFAIAAAMIAFMPRRQAVYDLAAGSVVLQQQAEIPRAAGTRRRSAIAAAVAIAILVPIGYVFFSATQDLKIRSSVAEIMGTARDLATSVADYRSAKGKWPASSADVGFDPDYRSPRGARIELLGEGRVRVTFPKYHDEAAIEGTQVELTPVESAAGIQWQCHNISAPNKYLPSLCRNAGGAERAQ